MNKNLKINTNQLELSLEMLKQNKMSINLTKLNKFIVDVKRISLKKDIIICVYEK